MWMAFVEIWSDPAFCYSAPAPHCNCRTPASSLIHDLPLLKKKRKKISFYKIIQFYKSHACVFQLSLHPCLNQDTPKKNSKGSEVANCCQTTKVLHQRKHSNAGGNHIRAPLETVGGCLCWHKDFRGHLSPGCLAARPTLHNTTTRQGHFVARTHEDVRADRHRVETTATCRAASSGG